MVGRYQKVAGKEHGGEGVATAGAVGTADVP